MPSEDSVGGAPHTIWRPVIMAMQLTGLAGCLLILWMGWNTLNTFLRVRGITPSQPIYEPNVMPFVPTYEMLTAIVIFGSSALIVVLFMKKEHARLTADLWLGWMK